jgi:hypothetical protein
MANARLELRVSEDGRQVVLVDKQRGCDWRLDPAQRLVGRVPVPASLYATTGPASQGETVLPDGSMERLPDGFRMTHRVPEGAIVYRWTLAGDHVRVVLESAPQTIETISLPGAFVPGEGKASLLLSAYQGVLYRPTGEVWEETRSPGGHSFFSMAMNALLGERGGLMVTCETATDWLCSFGENATSPYFFYNAARCEVDGWYPREVRLYPVESNITAVAKRYRQRVQERGEFVSWAEKIARKPVVEKLFGALFAFTGYNHAPEVDYMASARQLSTMGFANVLYYPVRMAGYSLDFLMGGDKPIWMPDETVQRVRDIPGALVSPWGWMVEGLDDGSPGMQKIYRRNPDGSAPPGWRIEKQQWYLVCPGEQITAIRNRFATDLQAMDWIHYDVNACFMGRQPCYAKDHPSHPDGPVSRRREIKLTQDILGPDVNGNRIVSSEGFVDRYTNSYDVGSAKLWPASGPDADCIPVPLTMLVFHDSTIHNWWEVHTYNPLPGFQGNKDSVFGTYGAGASHKMAALDALYGCPPQVFPFGRQYGWIDIQSRRTFSFCIQLSDVNVQAALQAALPVAQLHRRIGKLEMLSFELLTPDGTAQTTVFADGTRVVANVSDKAVETAFGRLPANSWKEIPA